ncbi:hypothetical protein X768_33705 [Mesorhizobium sp. LSJC265A00]|nr:hypothetical protein X768_33705 [Mesorhizobium sp. LSJC265A00]
MKPSAVTSPRLTARARTRRDNELPCASTFHIMFKDCCISPKTPEALTSKVMMPITAAQVPPDGFSGQVPPDGFSDALFSAVCRIFALSVPIIPVI